MESRDESLGRARQTRIAIPAGLLGFACVAVLEIPQIPFPGAALSVALLAFALAIPLLAVQALSYYINFAEDNDFEPWYSFAVGIAGWVWVAVGIGALIWHVWWLIGVAYVVSIAIALTAFMEFVRRRPKTVESGENQHADPAAAGQDG
jgi:hypothetical protein